MRKDNFGICIKFYAVLGFVLALLGHTTLALLLLGFVIVVHKDQWLTIQVMQAFFLSLISGIVSTIIGIISPIYSIPVIGRLFSGIFGVVTSLISLAILILAVIGILRTAKEQSADLPFMKGFAMKAFGFVENVTYTQLPQEQSQSRSQEQTQNKSQEQSQNQ